MEDTALVPGLASQVFGMATVGLSFVLATLAAAFVVARIARYLALTAHWLPEKHAFAGFLRNAAAPLGILVISVAAVLVAVAALGYWYEVTVWSWFPKYTKWLLWGLLYTISLLVLSLAIGGAMAVPIGLVQVTGPRWLAAIARWFCTIIRGTPLLIQLWLLYYGLGSLFPSIPWIRESFVWPVLREGYVYGLLALTLSFAGYEGEVMRGAFRSVPKGELEAARAYGMSPFTLLRRVWLPRAVRLVLPTIGGETILQLKATPVVATVTVLDLYGVTNMIRQDTFRVYEPLILVAVIYFLLVMVVTRLFTAYERMIPNRR